MCLDHIVFDLDTGKVALINLELFSQRKRFCSYIDVQLVDMGVAGFRSATTTW